MNYTLLGHSGTFEIPIPTGYQVLSEGETILEGDLYLEGGRYYNYLNFLVEFKPFINATLVPRTVDSEMVIIRPISK